MHRYVPDLEDCSDNRFMTVDLGAVHSTSGVTIWHYCKPPTPQGHQAGISWSTRSDYLVSADGNDRGYCNQRVALSITGEFAGEEIVVSNKPACSGW